MSTFDIESVSREPLYSKICRFVDHNAKTKDSIYIDVSTGRLIEYAGENIQVYVFHDLFCIPDAYDNIQETLLFCEEFFK